MLQALLARGTASLGRGVHTPGELNELLARTPAELERFQQACNKLHSLRRPFALDRCQSLGARAHHSILFRVSAVQLRVGDRRCRRVFTSWSAASNEP